MEEESMTITRSLFKGYAHPLASSIITITEQMAQRGIHAIFKARPAATAQNILGQLERRTIEDVVRLTHRNEIDIARVLVRFLQWGYVEFLGG